MCLAAAHALADFAEKNGLCEDYIIPKMTEKEVFPEVATAVGVKAVELGLAKVNMREEEIYELAELMISATQRKIKKLYELGFIREPPC
jgi:malic enzyme